MLRLIPETSLDRGDPVSLIPLEILGSFWVTHKLVVKISVASTLNAGMTRQTSNVPWLSLIHI